MTAEIQITKTKEEPGATTLAVEAPLEMVRAAERKATNYYVKRVRLPGFRKGKVPSDVVKRRFGDAIKDVVIRELVSDSWKQVLDREQLEPVGEPQVHHLKFEADQPVTFEFLVEVKPEIRIERVGGFSVARTKPQVTDQMVEEQLDHVRRQKGTWQPLEEAKPEPGDLVRVSIATSTGDEPGEARPYEIVIGQDQALPAVEEMILGLVPGQSAEKTITFPPDFGDESKRGQTVLASISLEEVKRQAVPDLTDDFAREVGDFESLAQLRESVREDLDRAAGHEADREVRRQLIEQIVAANNVPAPRPTVQRLLRIYAEVYQVSEENFEKFVTEFGPIVEAQVKRELVLDTVATKENLGATEEEVDGRVEAIASRQKTDPRKVYAALQKEKRLKELERSITEEKVFAFLLERSTITES